MATAVLSLGLVSLEIETSFESYLPETNERLEQYQRFRAQFGSGERVVILLEPRDVGVRGALAESRLAAARSQPSLFAPKPARCASRHVTTVAASRVEVAGSRAHLAGAGIRPGDRSPVAAR